MKHFILGSICLVVLLATHATAQGRVAKSALDAVLYRGTVSQVPLTAAERALLPVAGTVTHEMVYDFDSKTATLKSVTLPLQCDNRWLACWGKELSIPPKVQPFLPGIMAMDMLLSIRTDQQLPQFRPINNALLRKEFENKIALIARSQQDEPLFYSSLKSEIVRGPFGYDSYLPQERLDYVYIGETHRTPRIWEDIEQILLTLQQREPARKIYFATEYVADEPYAKNRLFSSPAGLRVVRDAQDPVFSGYPFLTKIVAAGIAVVGLEPLNAMIHEVSGITGQDFDKLSVEEKKSFESQRVLFGASPVGMALRNKKWKEVLRSLRQQEPDGLIVVHSGGAHVRTDELLSLPQNMGGRYVVFSFVGNAYQNYLPPVLQRINLSPAIVRDFGETLDNRVVFSIKGEDISKGRGPEEIEAFKKAMGADVVVLVHNEPAEEEKE